MLWTDQPPDFHRKSIEDLLSGLSFTDACAIASGGNQRPVVIAPRRAMHGIRSHLSERSVEMGGLLVGNVHDLDPSGSQFVVSIEDYARCDEFDGTGVSLRMETTVWELARLKAPEGSFVIGWYHSHPNLGAFFSATDRRTQRAFFAQPYCIGPVSYTHLTLPTILRV